MGAVRRVDQLRRTTSATMTTLTALCTAVAVGMLLSMHAERRPTEMERAK